MTTANGTDDFFHALYIHEACAEFLEEGENESESTRLSEVRLRDGHAGDNDGAVNRVLQWGSLARDRVLLARYERYRTVRHLSCESSSAATSQSGNERKADDSRGPRAVRKTLNDQHAIPRIGMLLTGKTSSEARFTASDPTPFEKLPDEVSASMWRSIIFSSYPPLWVILARAAARPTASRRLVRECIL